MIKNILGDYDDLLKNAEKSISYLKTDSPLTCDHICFRVETNERYVEVKNRLSTIAQLMGETIVAGRPISIFRLNNHIKYNKFHINCIELPAPKQGSHYIEGWEHAEFIVPDINKFIEDNHSVKFNTKSITRNINPEVSIRINEKHQIKFHPLHILDVLKIEEKMGVTQVN